MFTVAFEDAAPSHSVFAVLLSGESATGESYCIAQIRYLDEFVKQRGTWLFAE
jgi:hypothetical protein